MWKKIKRKLADLIRSASFTEVGVALDYSANWQTREEIAAFCRTMRARIQADAYYISPLESEGRIHYRRALTLLRKVNRLNPHLLPPWSLSIQMHKVIGIR